MSVESLSAYAKYSTTPLSIHLTARQTHVDNAQKKINVLLLLRLWFQTKKRRAFLAHQRVSYRGNITSLSSRLDIETIAIIWLVITSAMLRQF